MNPEYFNYFNAEYIAPKYIEKEAMGRCYYLFYWSRMSITRRLTFDAAIAYTLTALFVFSALFPNPRLLHLIFIVVASLLLLLSIPVGLSPILLSIGTLPIGYAIFVLVPRWGYNIYFPTIAGFLLPLLSFPLGILSHRIGLRKVMKTYNKDRIFKFTWGWAIALALWGPWIRSTIDRLFPAYSQFMDQYIPQIMIVSLLLGVPFLATAQLYRVHLIKKYCPYLATLADARHTNLDDIKKGGRWGWR